MLTFCVLGECWFARIPATSGDSAHLMETSSPGIERRAERLVVFRCWMGNHSAVGKVIRLVVLRYSRNRMQQPPGVFHFFPRSLEIVQLSSALFPNEFRDS